jgi:secreted trypsin-like serine protease
MSTSVMICAGARGGGTDISEGNSGGPIFDREGTLAGVVVSWGYGHARENLLGVYSRLSGTKDSIDVTIRELPSSHPASCGGRLTGAVEAIDTPGSHWYFGR